MSELFTPYRIGPIELRNRTIRSAAFEAMCPGHRGEIVHDRKMGYAVAPQADAIAEAIADYYTHDRQADYTEYLILQKENYSWEKLADTFYTIHKQL